jgi:hypothetical protein
MPTLNEVLNLSQLSIFTTAQQCLDYLNETTTQPGDSTPYTWSGIGTKLLQNGAAPADVMAFTANINSLPGGPLLNNCLLSGGLNLADPLVRYQIQSEEVNEPAWAVSIINAMLAIGAPQNVANWQILGIQSQPQLADIQAVLLQRMIGNVISPIQQAIHDRTLTTVAQVAAAAAAAFATQQANMGG